MLVFVKVLDPCNISNVYFQNDIALSDQDWSYKKNVLFVVKTFFATDRLFDHDNIWQVWPQLGCGDGYKIRTWYSICNQCFYHSVRNRRKQRNRRNSFVTPTQTSVQTLKSELESIHHNRQNRYEAMPRAGGLDLSFSMRISWLWVYILHHNSQAITQTLPS